VGNRANTSEDKIPFVSPPSVPPFLNSVLHSVPSPGEPSSNNTPEVRSSVCLVGNVQDGDRTQYVLRQTAQTTLTVTPSDSLHGAQSKIPSSEQPITGSIGLPEKIQKVKKGKKGTRTLLGKQRGAPWPPRPRCVQANVSKTSLPNKAVVEEPSQVLMASPPTEHEGDHTGQVLGEGAERFEKRYDNHQHAPFYVVHSSQKANAHDKTPEPYMVGEVPLLRPHIAAEILQAPQQHDLQNAPHTSAHAPPGQPSLSLEWKKAVDYHPNAYYEVTSQNAWLDHEGQTDHVVPRTTAPYAPVHPPRHVRFESQDTGSRDSQLFTATQDRVHRDLLHLEQTDATLHGVASQSVLHRVEKLPKTSRVVSGMQSLTAPALYRNCGPTMRSDFEQKCESLLVAYHDEQYKKHQDTTTQIKHFEEVKALLQDQIKQYSVTVAEWKDKYHTLSLTLEDLRTKAKTNQKYVSGLQKDHEKLHKSTVAFQDECKETMQQKIAEVESEKISLQREFEMTLETLARGQRNLRVTVDDLYMQLKKSRSNEQNLAENLRKQVEIYEEEKLKRFNLEAQLLRSVQGVERQFDDRSTQLIEKLETLQTSVGSMTHGNEHISGIQECLDILQKLQNIPFFTSKDVQKAEGMLQFVREE
jgi:hypothetical protein